MNKDGRYECGEATETEAEQESARVVVRRRMGLPANEAARKEGEKGGQVRESWPWLLWTAEETNVERKVLACAHGDARLRRRPPSSAQGILEPPSSQHSQGPAWPAARALIGPPLAALGISPGALQASARTQPSHVSPSTSHARGSRAVKRAQSTH